ncbi:MAG: ATP-dependent RNA helicase dbp4 [Vezdaea aestivalis]|nr:MAG: ATP-dependent RNA helicase dbp4 [Vezdaea aestivalis]
MAPATNGRNRPAKPKQNTKTLKRKRKDEDIQSLQNRVNELAAIESPNFTHFNELPLSIPTSSGLSRSQFTDLTIVQSRTLPTALRGLDILAAAKTGSGKTLAFLIPVLENLYRARWTQLDGLGALILSPTRELAIQIYDVLQRVGRYHTFSAGLVIGGKSLADEQDLIGRMNILVCTPGRMLQHLDQTVGLAVDDLRMLVLDEADRILDMGFKGTVDAIISHLPSKRQTLLFSATQTKRVADLARLSLQDPEYVSVHEKADAATPVTLKQHYVVTPLPDKLNTLYSFLRSNLKAKILVFMSSGKQVRFVYETFRRLQPGIPLLHILGAQKQTARLDITSRFRAVQHACLFATDVVARGLDFPAVDWVLQLDCPEDADTYIHRVGRTARYQKDGRAVLFLLPSEEPVMLTRLAQKKIPIESITVREKKQQSVQTQLQNMCFKDPELKYLGQKAFTTYARSVHLQRDKEVFDLAALPLEDFATSLGLPGAPRIKFVKGEDIKQAKNRSRLNDDSTSSEAERDKEGDEEGEPSLKKRKQNGDVRTKYDRMFERRNQDVLTEHYSKLVTHNSSMRENGDADHSTHLDDVDSDGDFLTVKRRLSPSSALSLSLRDQAVETPSFLSTKPDSVRQARLLRSKRAVAITRPQGTKTVFDDEGNANAMAPPLQTEQGFKANGAAALQRERFLETEKRRIREADELDKGREEERRRLKKEKRRKRELEDDVEDEGEDREDTKRRKKWFEDDEGTEWVEGRKHKKGERKVGVGVDVDNVEDLEALAEDLLA